MLGCDYYYGKLSEDTFRVTYAKSLYDSTLNRSYQYDHVGRLWASHSGSEADGHVGETAWPSQPTGPYAHNYSYDVWGNHTQRGLVNSSPTAI